MEETIAILMADLSGYTAMTEAHGAVAAADLIDKYIAIVERCLVGDSKLHERTGDEVMIVSSSPDFLLATAELIARNTLKEDHFLQLHGGLHYGNVLKRGNSYFGTAINLTSRIAGKANAGTYWCSQQYVDALSDKSTVRWTTKGSHSFKNISREQNMFELSLKDSQPLYIDPVCQMRILDLDHAFTHPTHASTYFCSLGCIESYKVPS
jgi:adenylate cyclase